MPTFIIKRLPVRLTYDNNYFNNKYQGIPISGYTKIAQNMLSGIEIKLNTDFFKDRQKFQALTNHIVYTGPLDEYFDYQLGKLEWRSLKFKIKVLNESNHQGCAVVNYTDHNTNYTRVIEHKHFEINNSSDKTIITYEYPATYEEGAEKYYTVNDEANNKLATAYRSLIAKEPNVIFGGRLAEYKYYDMDDVIKKALDTDII